MLDNFPEISKLPLSKKVKLVEEIWEEIRFEKYNNEVPEDIKKSLNQRRKSIDYEKLLTLEELKTRLESKK